MLIENSLRAAIKILPFQHNNFSHVISFLITVKWEMRNEKLSLWILFNFVL
jgi:hypothetical protein